MTHVHWNSPSVVRQVNKTGKREDEQYFLFVKFTCKTQAVEYLQVINFLHLLLNRVLLRECDLCHSWISTYMNAIVSSATVTIDHHSDGFDSECNFGVERVDPNFSVSQK